MSASGWLKRLSDRHLLFLFVAFCTLAAPPARAQTPTGVIEGLVRDESGGVMPGVTVEVASPALLEAIKTTVTEATGNYQFLRLPVGDYSVKFSLSGFKTVIRSKVVITAGFTATINAELGVGALEETLTVTGESPLVDVRTTTGRTVVTSEVVNTIPSSRNLTDMSKFVLGASTSTPDVGGSTMYNYVPIQVHGSRVNDRSNYIDGFYANGLFGDGSTPVAWNGAGSREEFNFQTNAIPASFAFGGAVMSAVTKSGGNKFSGELFGPNVQVMQSSNLDDALRARGVKATAGSTGSIDIDVSFGGPIKKDSAWFFGSVRHQTYEGLVANSFVPDGSQAVDPDRRDSYFGKISLKLNSTSKLAITLNNEAHVRPYRRSGANFVAPEAANYNYFTPNLWSSVAWTGTHGNSWLYEILASHFFAGKFQSYRPEVGPNDVPRLDIVTSTLTGAPTSMQHPWEETTTINGSLTRVGKWAGSHELKVGVQSQWGHQLNDWNPWNGDIILRFRSGVPDSVDLTNTPISTNEWESTVGVYLQDAWRIGQRLTVNAGVRYDEFHSWLPATSTPAGTWLPARQFPAQSLKPFRNAVPRLGVAYDLTGTAQTVVKGSFSKYLGNEGLSLIEGQNPAFLSMNRCVWKDTNADLYAQASEISACAGWTGGVTTTIDPNLRRSYSNEYSLGVQRQLTPSLAASVTYFHRENLDSRATLNLAVPTASYIPVVITNPLTSQPLTIYNQSPATAGLQNSVLTNSPLLDTHYNGIEFALERRFSAGAFLQAGYAYGKAQGYFKTSDPTDPNNLIYGEGAVGTDEPHQVKVSGAFVLPWEISVSGFLQAYSGLPRQTILAVGRTLVPSLTRATQNVALEPNDVNRYDSNLLVDLRLGRRFRVGAYRFEGFADLYNLTNANTVLAQVTTYGASLGNVSNTIQPRLVKVGARFSF